jgi:hypothetical protein
MKGQDTSGKPDVIFADHQVPSSRIPARKDSGMILSVTNQSGSINCGRHSHSRAQHDNSLQQHKVFRLPIPRQQSPRSPLNPPIYQRTKHSKKAPWRIRLDRLCPSSSGPLRPSFTYHSRSRQSCRKGKLFPLKNPSSFSNTLSPSKSRLDSTPTRKTSPDHPVLRPHNRHGHTVAK